MSRVTGPVVAIGAITVINRSVFNGKAIDWKVPVATVVAAGLLELAERAVGDVAVWIAYLALTAVVLTRVDPEVPSPAESALKWFNER